MDCYVGRQSLPYLVCVLDAATLAIILFPPFLMPDIGAILGPLVSPLVGPPQGGPPLSPLLLPLISLHSKEIACINRLKVVAALNRKKGGLVALSHRSPAKQTDHPSKTGGGRRRAEDGRKLHASSCGLSSSHCPPWSKGRSQAMACSQVAVQAHSPAQHCISMHGMPGGDNRSFCGVYSFSFGMKSGRGQRSTGPTLASWAHLWAVLSTVGSPVKGSKVMASRQVSLQADPSALQPVFSAPISFMPAQSLASHQYSSHSTCSALP